jgi:hypothetical protein
MAVAHKYDLLRNQTDSHCQILVGHDVFTRRIKGAAVVTYASDKCCPAGISNVQQPVFKRSGAV